MLDAKKILDQLLGSGGGLSRGGGLPTLGGKGGGGSGDLLSQVGGLAKGNLGGLAGGALAGSLASILLGGKGKKSPLSGSAMKLGGLAILGGLAYKAWQNSQAGRQTEAASQTRPEETQALPQRSGPVELAPPPPDSPFAPSSSSEEQKLGLLLIRTMIAAARADGHIDREEISKIREGLKSVGGEDDEQDFLLEHLGRPDDLDAIAAEARGPELASEVWLAARLTIDADTQAERDFLDRLAAKLGLGAPLVAHLEQTAAQAKQQGVTAA
jgi:uncharacterized membrane protein YebE (DUF533 family)